MDLLDSFGAKSAGELPPPPRPQPKRPSRRQTRPFLRGPIPLDWLAAAYRLGRPALGVGLALWIVRGFNGKAGAVRLSSSVRRRLEISTTDSRRGLAALRGAGLVQLVKGGRGRCPVVEIVDGLPAGSAAEIPDP